MEGCSGRGGEEQWKEFRHDFRSPGDSDESWNMTVVLQTGRICWCGIHLDGYIGNLLMGWMWKEKRDQIDYIFVLSASPKVVLWLTVEKWPGWYSKQEFSFRFVEFVVGIKSPLEHINWEHNEKLMVSDTNMNVLSYNCV